MAEHGVNASRSTASHLSKWWRDSQPSSGGGIIAWANAPWVRAFQRLTALPSWVQGPVER